MKQLIQAIRFITILPVGCPAGYDPKGMIPYFPIVGLLLGGMTAVFDQLALRLWAEPVVSLLDVIFLVVLTGAFHLDGLGDAADGLLGHRPRERVLEVMKDSRIGVMGLTVIVCGLSLKWAGIMSLGSHRSLLLVLIPAYARAGMVFGIRFLRYGRSAEGIGNGFFGEPLKLSAFLGVFSPVLISIFLGWKAFWLNACFVLITAAILGYFKKRMNCITGDMLGAMTEVLESFLFMLAAAGGAG
jgi:adenosylcobinamide-GDP ribazoletransferase